MDDISCKIAFKEWAAVCEALAAGRQTIILRKGGLQDEIESIRRACQGFWLYPTNFHQQADVLSSDAGEFIERATATRPPMGQIALRLFAKLSYLNELTTEEMALRLNGLHIWSESTVRQRFAYRYPLLFLLGVRVYSLKEAILIPESPAMAGCKSWVDLPTTVATENIVPVLTDPQFASQLARVHSALA